MRHEHRDETLAVQQDVQPVRAVRREESDRAYRFAGHNTLVYGSEVELAVRQIAKSVISEHRYRVPREQIQQVGDGERNKYSTSCTANAMSL